MFIFYTQVLTSKIDSCFSDVIPNISDSNAEIKSHWFKKKGEDRTRNARHFKEMPDIADLVPESSTLKYFFSNFAPVFRFCFILFCGVVAASVDVERLWSQAGNIVTDRRNRLMEDKLTAELFVKFNKDVPIHPVTTTFKKPSINSSKLFIHELLPPVELVHSIEVDHNIENVSSLECSDEEIQALVKDVEEEFIIAELDPFWSSSAATKHFSNSVNVLLQQPGSQQQMVTRNRKGIIIIILFYFYSLILILTDNSKKAKPLSKRDLKAQCGDWVPQYDDSVLVALEPENCLCGVQCPLDCICVDVWYPGVVISGSKKKGFNVFFSDLVEERLFSYTECDDRWILL